MFVHPPHGFSVVHFYIIGLDQRLYLIPGSDTRPQVSQSQRIEEMCPLRLILIFLSATLAGFFVLRNLRSQPQPPDVDDDAASIPMNPQSSDSSNPSPNESSKIRGAVQSGFWTLVDMASGRYLWRQLVSSSSKRSS